MLEILPDASFATEMDLIKDCTNCYAIHNALQFLSSRIMTDEKGPPFLWFKLLLKNWI